MSARAKKQVESYKYKHLAKALICRYDSINHVANLAGWNRMSLVNMLTGKHAPNKNLIDAVLDLADMTYEEAFVEDVEA